MGILNRKNGLIATGWLLSIPGANSRPLTQELPKLCSQKSVTIAQNLSTIWPWQEFMSSSAQPPYLEINMTGQELGQAPFIMTDTGDLVWSGPYSSDASNFRVQALYEEPVITYWAGSGSAASSTSASHGYGHIVLYNSSYDQIGTICPNFNLTLPPGTTAPCQADVHESFITPDNTIIVTAYNTTKADLREFGGPEDGWVLDPLVYELDMETLEILFSWSPLAHVPLSDTRLPLAGAGNSSSDPFDFFHTNAVQPFEGNYLINSRSCWKTYLVDRNGNILWTIDGKTGGDFGTLPEGGQFSWEHFARIERVSETQLKLRYFANNNYIPTTSNASVGLELLLTVPPNPDHPPQVLKNLSDPLFPVASLAMGSHDILSNGNHFLGYGIQPVMKEFGPHNPQGDDVRWSARYNFESGAASYRTYKTSWRATPSSKPDLVVMRSGKSSSDGLNGIGCGSSTIRGYVSWNGATDVKYYMVYTGSKKDSMTAAGIVERQGFETEFVIPEHRGHTLVQVGAVEDAQAGVVRKSAVMKL
ncbi:hypothetical protein N7528_005279 [Penicillium herquei]|nr:hypothetical protein N7528_005279 [Penicillium herquei]